MKRYRILLAAVVMQMCLGATYAWSVFVLPLKQITAILQSTAQLPFSLFYFAFPATMIVTGALLPKIGPRRCAVVGGLLFGGGWMLAALGRLHFAFTILGIGLMAGLAAGFAVNANMKELYTGTGVQSGMKAVAAFALANAAGRITWGWIFDRSRSSAVILQANLLLQAALLLLHGFILRSETGLVTFAALAGFNYGGILVLYASAAAERWGSEQFSQIYGWLFSANIPAAASPIIAGIAFDRLGSFSPVLWGIGGLMVCGAIALGLKMPMKSRKKSNFKLNHNVTHDPVEAN